MQLKEKIPPYRVAQTTLMIMAKGKLQSILTRLSPNALAGYGKIRSKFQIKAQFLIPKS
jgi:hypothetical protein